MPSQPAFFFFFFFNDTATTEIYTLSLHDALPIWKKQLAGDLPVLELPTDRPQLEHRSEEHTSELQSQSNLVCRLLLEKKKKQPIPFLLHHWSMQLVNHRYSHT